MIDGKYPYSRGYECLSFSGFLKICLPGSNAFIDGATLASFTTYLDGTFVGLRSYVDKYQYLKQRNLLPEICRIDIAQLKFYQDEINVDRLDKLVAESYFSRPAIIVKFENKLILQDGYHRTCISMIDKANAIDCYLI